FSPIDSHQAFSNATATVTAQSTDSVQQGTATTTILSVGQTLAGTIDAEPMASDIPISLPDGAGGYVDKDWFKVTLDKGKLYTFTGNRKSPTRGVMDVSLYGSNGTQVHAPVEGASPSFTFDTTYQANANQVYYLAVSAGGAEPAWRTATGDYSVSVSSQTAN